MFFSLSGAQNIIFIGHGPACQPVMELIDARCSFFSAIFTWLLLTRFPVVNSITKRVKAVIQVVGNGKVPVTPKKSDELRSWYGKVVLLELFFTLSFKNDSSVFLCASTVESLYLWP